MSSRERLSQVTVTSCYRVQLVGSQRLMVVEIGYIAGLVLMTLCE